MDAHVVGALVKIVFAIRPSTPDLILQHSLQLRLEGLDTGRTHGRLGEHLVDINQSQD